MLILMILLSIGSIYAELEIFRSMFQEELYLNKRQPKSTMEFYLHRTALWVIESKFGALVFSMLLSHFIGMLFGAMGLITMVAGLVSTIFTNVAYKSYLSHLRGQVTTNKTASPKILVTLTSPVFVLIRRIAGAK